MNEVEVLPTRDCEAGYGPDYTNQAYFVSTIHSDQNELNKSA